MAEAGDRVCWTVQFSGMVQGVGFRYQTERVAQAFDVTGYVRNTPDGRVEVVAEGQPGEVQRFLAAQSRRVYQLEKSPIPQVQRTLPANRLQQ